MRCDCLFSLRAVGDWVLGMVERTDERKIVLVVVKDRTRETLHSIIDKFVLPGSIIHTDMWGGYVGVERLPGKYFEHKTLCHDREFGRESAKDIRCTRHRSASGTSAR